MTTLEICLLQWESYNKRIKKILEEMPDDQFQAPILPGGNSPSWIMGHVTDTDDKLLELMGIGKRKHPELEAIYHHERGKNQSGHLSRAELLKKWSEINAEIERTFKKWNEAEWLSRHTAVSEEDFAKEPHRNRLNVMLGRVSHRASHLGQVAMSGKG